MALPASADELYRSRRRSNKDRRKFVGKRIYEVDEADVDDAEVEAWTEYWTLQGHSMRPSSVAVDPHYRSGKGRLVILYEDHYNPRVYPTGRATISTIQARVSSQWEEIRYVYDAADERWVDLQGDPDAADYGAYYRHFHGLKERLKQTAVLKLNTGIWRKDFSLSGLMSTVGGYNAASFIGFPPKTLLYGGVEVPGYFMLGEDYSVVPVSYVLLHDPNEWETSTYIQKWQKMLTIKGLVKTIDADGGAVDYYDPAYSSTGVAEENAKKERVWVTEKIDGAGEGAWPREVVQLTPDVETFTTLEGLLWWIS